MDFKLWLEFEHWEPQRRKNPYQGFFQARLTLSDGRVYALNVWTFGFLAATRQEDKDSGGCLQGAYLLPPDLFVERLDRGLMERVVADLIKNNALKEEWRTEALPCVAEGEICAL